MLRPDFNLNDKLASLACPRCGRVGLDQISEKALQQVNPADAHQSIGVMDPAVPVRCPGCGLAAEWPAVSERNPRGQESQNRPGNFREGDTLDPGTPPPAFPLASAKPTR